ncbi:hypothetical protein DQ04_00631030 [Trypanosoma grayi]|uniref:hypothetical protein n=1 Tax=Trypanosoma grayi TaxID=71804 RepID=UPI0004F4266B|nr:hypothetical protein DQ04_00631030 [Trypanosoma grayi]KEG14079.1 hypothetical protein DQ04_00631030 [Trypanosoma grayi]
MKGLEEWLASSSSSDEANDASVMNAPPPPARRYASNSDPRAADLTRQEVTRSRMRSILGDGVVTAVAAQSKAQEDAGSTPRPLSPVSRRKSLLEPPIPLGGGSSRSNTNNKSSASTTSPAPETTTTEYRRVEVMVVDRGTQTTSTVGCQTDPEPTPPYVAFPFAPGPVCRCGVRRPCANVLNEDASTTRFKEQLETIQNSIDMMIARYNLPPPPLPRVQ